MYIRVLIFSCVFQLCLQHHAYAWGAKGHKITAQIAAACLTKQVMDSVQSYLGEISFEEASVWMDEVRSDPNYNFLKPRHYINVEKDSLYRPVKEANIVNELERVMDQLKHKPNRAETAFALLELFHLVGDLHQPLHCGYAADKGGNTVDVDFVGRSSNLHRVWDTDLIEKTGITKDQCLIRLNSYSSRDKTRMVKINIIDWMTESRSHLNKIYDFQKGLISQKYVDLNKELVKDQLARAGVRLAAVLDLYFRRK